jgi:hypothetical protein
MSSPSQRLSQAPDLPERPGWERSNAGPSEKDHEKRTSRQRPIETDQAGGIYLGQLWCYIRSRRLTVLH